MIVQWLARIPYNQGRKCWTTDAYILSVIFLLPNFNVDPHRTGADSTIKRNIETGVVRGIPFLRQGFKITISSHNRAKNLILVLWTRWMELIKKGGPITFGPDCRSRYVLLGP